MRLRLATFNLENLDTSSRGVPLDERCRVLRPQLVALDADVLCLQEVSAHARRRVEVLEVERREAQIGRASCRERV